MVKPDGGQPASAEDLSVLDAAAPVNDPLASLDSGVLIKSASSMPPGTKPASIEPVYGFALSHPVTLPDSGGPKQSWFGWLWSAVRWCFGCGSLVLLLAVLATIPVVQLLSLGYLLEVSGRVARTGRIRAGFVGVRKASVAGGILLAGWLLVWPLRFAASMWTSAMLIDPTSPAANIWRWVLIALTIVIGLHGLGACFRGARLRDFLIPRPLLALRLIFRRGALGEARDALWTFVTGLRLPYYFWLGARGFAGAFLWLAIPTSALAVATRFEPKVAVLIAFLGGLLLTFVLLHLPLLQAAFAAENRLGAMFELRRNRRRFAHAPLAYAMALLVALLLATPLFLLKIEIVPQEAAWLPSLLFVLSVFPARLLSGWALARANRREVRRHWFWRWSGWLAMVPVAGIYVLLVFISQYLSWYGVWSLYEQHAFLVPVPFLGL